MTDVVEYVGKSLYQTHILKEFKRYIVFRSRCAIHGSSVCELLRFFDDNDLRRAILKGSPGLFEQTTRAFFYKGSTWSERVNLVEKHILLLEAIFNEEFFRQLYVNVERIPVWQDTYLDKPLQLQLQFHAGQRKEGCLALVLNYEETELYQIVFWLAPAPGEAKPEIFVGAIQGTPNGSEIIKGLTKAYFGYRTKNLIFYGLRSFARAIGATAIYGVSNDGYYAMNHLRSDRKLKTDFGSFWQECEGVLAQDARFYLMPVAEHRKTMEELKPSKRAQHRRRFAKMDEIKASVAAKLAQYKK